MTVRLKTLKKCACVYMALPLFAFIAGWLRLPAALISGAAALAGLTYAIRSAAGEERRMQIGAWELAALILVVLLWTYLGGLNGLFYQSSDWNWRNAVYHDLIDRAWPVVYPEKGSALSYYIGFWLPPALLAKLAGAMGGAVWAWRVARMALWLWAALGLTITILMLMLWAAADTKGRRAAVALTFVFFSGLDVVGALLSGRLALVTAPETLHFEWWMPDGKQYSSITTCLYWVFNQSIVSWMAVMLFLCEKDERNYVFIALSCLCCGPLPCVGLAVCMVVRCGQRLLRSFRAGEGHRAFQAVFSPGNLIALIVVIPLGLYYLSNMAVTHTAGSALPLMTRLGNYFLSRSFWAFFVLEAGIWLALLGWEHRREALFYGVAVSLLIIPFFHLGASEDFCMRVSIPCVMILTAWCARYFCTRPAVRAMSRRARLRFAAVLAAFVIGAATPCMEIYRGIYHAVTEKTIRLAQDGIGSIASLEKSENFTAENYDKSAFFRFFGIND